MTFRISHLGTNKVARLIYEYVPKLKNEKCHHKQITQSESEVKSMLYVCICILKKTNKLHMCTEHIHMQCIHNLSRYPNTCII